MKRNFQLLSSSFICIFFTINLFGQTDKLPMEQRTVTNKFDLQKNEISNIQFYCTNYGVFGMNVKSLKGGLFWPRFSGNQYIFAGGFWVGAKKRLPSGEISKLVSIGYNNYSGKGWFVPGRIDENVNFDSLNKTQYRLYYSTDFDDISGVVKNQDDGADWCLWHNKAENTNWFYISANYIQDTLLRKYVKIANEPLMVSDEDIFSTFHDGNLNYYEGGSAARQAKGYPLGLQVDSRILTWNDNHDLKDVMLLQYYVTNTSNDTLFDVYFANIIDPDLVASDGNKNASSNDRIRFYDNDPKLNMGIVWTNTDQGEAGKGFGYAGIGMIETPAVDMYGNLKDEKLYYEPEEQIGLNTFRYFTLLDNIADDTTRYNLIETPTFSGDVGPTEVNVALSTGGFKLLPKQGFRVTSFILFGMPSKGGEADGTDEDVVDIAANAKKVWEIYYDKLNSVEDDVVRKIEMYPNPADNYLYIDGLYGEITIYNLLNQIVWNGKLNGKNVINLDNFSSGMYFIKSENCFEKFIKK